MNKIALVSVDPAATNGQVAIADGSGGFSWGPAGGSAPDSTSLVKGILQLAGDFAGTAAAPQVGTVLNGKTPETTDKKGAVSGYMGLDGSGVGAQPPKAHAQSAHGRGGTDTLLNGLEVSDTTAQQTNHTFLFGPRTNTALTNPVPTLQPKTAALVCALDIAPSAGATAQANNGFAWIDVCDGPVIDAVTFNQTSMRVGNGGQVGGAQVGDVSTRKFGTAAAIPLALSADWDGSSHPQIYMSPRTGTNPTVVLGWDGSDALVGVLAPIATSSTKGFLYIPTCAGTPTGVPHWTNANGGSPIIVDTTGSKIWVNIGGTWKGVVVA